MNTTGKLVGLALIVPLLMVHEFLHAVRYPPNATVEVFIMKAGLALVSTEAISRIRYVMMVLSPCIVLGFLPVTAWIFVPKKHVTFSTALFVCGMSMFGGCTADTANAIRAIREMPRGSFLQTSGLKVYWFTREETR